MKKYNWLTLWALALITFFSTGCDSEDVAPMPTVNYQKIAESMTETADIKVEVYSTDKLSTGYNPLHIALFDAASGKRIEQASIKLQPMMHMMDKQHAAPAENPTADRAVDGLFSGAVVFTMPSGDMGSWTLTVEVEADGRKTKAIVPVTVVEPATSRLKSFVSKTDGAKYLVAYLQPQEPKVGVNNLEVAVYRVNGMMDFPADGKLTLELNPEMPAMGHGSPNNVNPVHQSGGHYIGKVNFTMTGLWHLHLTLKDGAEEAGKVYFEVNF